METSHSRSCCLLAMPHHLVSLLGRNNSGTSSYRILSELQRIVSICDCGKGYLLRARTSFDERYCYYTVAPFCKGPYRTLVHVQSNSNGHAVASLLPTVALQLFGVKRRRQHQLPLFGLSTRIPKDKVATLAVLSTGNGREDLDD